MTKELIINALLAGAWAFLAQLETVEGIEYLPLLVVFGRAVVGYLATKLGRPIPVDE